MKKPKLNLGTAGLKGLLMEHVEKIVLGVVLIAALLLFYMGLNVESFPETNTPDWLRSKITQADNKLKENTWSKMEEALERTSIKDPIVLRVNPDRWRLREINPPYEPPRSKRSDPALSAPTDPEVVAGAYAVAMLAK